MTNPAQTAADTKLDAATAVIAAHAELAAELAAERRRGAAEQKRLAAERRRAAAAQKHIAALRAAAAAARMQQAASIRNQTFQGLLNECLPGLQIIAFDGEMVTTADLDDDDMPVTQKLSALLADMAQMMKEGGC